MKSGTLLAVLISTLCCGTAASAAQVTVASWGGAWQDAQETTAAKPFAAQSGVQVKTDTYNGGIAQLRSQVQTNNVTWDVVDMQLADAIRACDEGLLEKVNPTMLLLAKDGTHAKSDYDKG